MGQFRFTATGAHLPLDGGGWERVREPHYPVQSSPTLDPSRKGEGDDCTIGAQPQNNSSGEKQ